MARANRFASGQRWSYKTNLEEFEHTLVIAGGPDLSEEPPIYTVYVRYNSNCSTWVPPGVDGVVLGLSEDELNQSVNKLIKSRVRLPKWWHYGQAIDPENPPSTTVLHGGGSADEVLRALIERQQQAEQGRKRRAGATSREEILRQLQPWKDANKRFAWKPSVSGKDGSLIASKFSGTPWLAEGEAWPVCPNCRRPLQLFLQLNLSELPDELASRFGSGLLQLFYCVATNSVHESEFCNVQDARAFGDGKLVRLVQPDTRRRKLEIPVATSCFPPKAITSWKRLDDFPNSQEHRDLGLNYTYDYSAETVRVQCPGLRLDFSNLEMEMAETISSALEGDKLAGWPRWVQNAAYPNCPRCKSRMELVFQLDSEDNVPFMFGDKGRGHITQCPVHKEVVTFCWACS